MLNTQNDIVLEEFFFNPNAIYFILHYYVCEKVKWRAIDTVLMKFTIVVIIFCNKSRIHVYSADLMQIIAFQQE